MGFKEYLKESLIVEAKVKVGGKEYASKKDAGMALAKQGKTAEQIEKIAGLSFAGAKWCIAQIKSDKLKNNKDYHKELKKVEKDRDDRFYNRGKYRDENKEKIESLENKRDEVLSKYDMIKDKSSSRANMLYKQYEDLSKEIQKLQNNTTKEQNQKKDLLNKLKDELKNAESESKGKLNSGDAYVLTLKRKIKELEEKPKDDNKNELKAVRKELQSYGKEYDRLETLIRKLRDKGEVFEMHKAERRLKELEDKMQTLHGKEQDLIG